MMSAQEGYLSGWEKHRASGIARVEDARYLCWDSALVKMPRISKVDGGKQESEREDQVRQVKNEVMDAVLAADPVHFYRNLSARLIENTCGVERGGRGRGAMSACGPKLGPVAGSAGAEGQRGMRWIWRRDKAMMRPLDEFTQWSEGRRLQGETVQRTQGAGTNEEGGAEWGRTQARAQGHGGMLPWRNIIQEVINELWKELCGKTKENMSWRSSQLRRPKVRTRCGDPLKCTSKRRKRCSEAGTAEGIAGLECFFLCPSKTVSNGVMISRLWKRKKNQ